MTLKGKQYQNYLFSYESQSMIFNNLKITEWLKIDVLKPLDTYAHNNLASHKWKIEFFIYLTIIFLIISSYIREVCGLYSQNTIPPWITIIF